MTTTTCRGCRTADAAMTALDTHGRHSDQYIAARDAIAAHDPDCARCAAVAAERDAAPTRTLSADERTDIVDAAANAAAALYH